MQNVVSFLRYAAESVIRGRERSFFSLLGVTLTISFLAGNLIAVDAAAKAMLGTALDASPFDFVGYEWPSGLSGISESSWSSQKDTLSSVPYVEEVAVAARITGFEVTGEMSDATVETDLIFLSENCDRFMDSFKIQGSLPERGGVAISEEMCSELGVQVGDSLFFSYDLFNGTYENGTLVGTMEYLNLSFVISAVWAQGEIPTQPIYDPTSAPITGMTPVHDPDSIMLHGTQLPPNPVFFGLADSDLVTSPMCEFGLPYGYEGTLYDLISLYFIWIDRAEVVSLADLDRSVERLEFIREGLASAGGSYGVQFYDAGLLSGQLSILSDYLERAKPVFVGLVFPLIAIGVYLSFVGADVGMRKRRREIGVLKSRGATERQLFSSFALESLVLGATAGIAGTLIGIPLSYLLIGTAVPFLGGAAGTSVSAGIFFRPSTLLAAVVFGIALIAVANWFPERRAARLAVVDALHYDSRTSAEPSYKARYDLALLAIGIFCIVSVFLVKEPGFGRGSFVIVVLTDIAWTFGQKVHPLLPFLLAFSIARLATLSRGSFYSKLSFITKPWTAFIHDVVKKNLVRSPRTASNVSVTIALALAFGIFISASMESTIKYQRDAVFIEVGADISASGNYVGYYGPGSNLSKLDQVYTLEGIEEVCAIQQAYGFDSATQVWYLWVAAFDVEAYMSIMSESNPFYSDALADALGSIKTSGVGLMRTDFAERLGILVGEEVRFQMGYHNIFNMTEVLVDISVRIVGFVDWLPGMMYNTIYMNLSSFSTLPSDVVESALTHSFLIDVSEDSDEMLVAYEIDRIYKQTGMWSYGVQVKDARLAEIDSDPRYGALLAFMRAEYVLVLALMASGISMVMFMSVTDRQREFASIMARGMSKSQLRRLLLGELAPLLVFGSLVGVSVGVLSAYVFTAVPLAHPHEFVEHVLVFGTSSWIALIVSVLSVMIAAPLAIAYAGRIDLAQSLRVREG